MKNKYMEEKEQEMLSLYLTTLRVSFSTKRAGGFLKLLLQPFWRRFPALERTVPTVEDRSVWSEGINWNSKNDGLIWGETWSHGEALNQSTDVYRFVSLLQCSTVYSVTCQVRQRDGDLLLDCGCEDCCRESVLLWRISILLYVVDDVIWSP